MVAPKPSIVVYAGEGTFQPSVNAIEARLDKYKNKYTITLANEYDFLDILERTNTIRLLILSPGTAAGMYFKLESTGKVKNISAKIQELITKGMNVYGIGAGAMLACTNYYERNYPENGYWLGNAMHMKTLKLVDVVMAAPLYERVLAKNIFEPTAENIKFTPVINASGTISTALNIIGPFVCKAPNDSEIIEKIKDIKMTMHVVSQKMVIEELTLKNPISAIFIRTNGGNILLDGNTREFSPSDFYQERLFSNFIGYKKVRLGVAEQAKQLDDTVFDQYMHKLGI